MDEEVLVGGEGGRGSQIGGKGGELLPVGGEEDM